MLEVAPCLRQFFLKQIRDFFALPLCRSRFYLVAFFSNEVPRSIVFECEELDEGVNVELPDPDRGRVLLHICADEC